MTNEQIEQSAKETIKAECIRAFIYSRNWPDTNIKQFKEILDEWLNDKYKAEPQPAIDVEARLAKLRHSADLMNLQPKEEKSDTVELLNDLYSQLQNEHLSEFMEPLMDKLEEFKNRK